LRGRYPPHQFDIRTGFFFGLPDSRLRDTFSFFDPSAGQDPGFKILVLCKQDSVILKHGNSDGNFFHDVILLFVQ